MFSICIHLHHPKLPEIVNDILCDFPSSGILFFEVGRVLIRKTVEGMSFVNWGGEEGLNAVSRLDTVS
jgi:hypothetical protein